jgi:hypothetical protein
VFNFATDSARRFAMFPSPVQNLLVSVAVDAPASAFALADGRDYVEVKLRGQNDAPRLYADRQVTTRLKKLAADGVLTMHADVNDYVVPLPVEGLDNLRVDLDASVWLKGSRRQDAAPVEVLLDGTPPKLERITRTAVTADEKAVFLHAELGAGDGLTGVAWVEFILDKNGNQRLDKEDPVLRATPSRAEDLWSVDWDLTELKLAPGKRYDLFARGGDRVGWIGLPEAEPAGSFSYPDKRQLVPSVSGVVKGTIKFKGQPVTLGRVTVSLSYGEPEKTIRQKSAPDGSYELRGVPAGKHKVVFSGNFGPTPIDETREVEISAAAREQTVNIDAGGK